MTYASPVEDAIVSKFAVWFRKPVSWRVELPTVAEIMWSIDAGIEVPMPMLPEREMNMRLLFVPPVEKVSEPVVGTAAMVAVPES